MTTFPELGASPLALRVVEVDDALDRAAFTFLYERHAPRVFRFLRDLLGDATLALDATQETFARALHHAEILRDRERAVPWLFGVARNISLELRKSRARAARVIVAGCGEIASEAPEQTPSPEGLLLGREAVRVIDVALAKLSDDRRAMLLLRLDHGISYEDIASTMGFSLAKVKVEIHRAREVLRTTLAEYQRGEPTGPGSQDPPNPPRSEAMNLDDEFIERELFQLRAEAMARPILDVDEVFARAARRHAADARRKRIAGARMARAGAWLSAAACAAASVVGVLHAPSTALGDRVTEALVREPAAIPFAATQDAEGLMCGAAIASTAVEACVAPRGDGVVPVASIAPPETSGASIASPPISPMVDALICEHDVTFSSARP